MICEAGARCAGFDRFAKIAAEAERGRLCDGCLKITAHDIMRLPHDYAALGRELAPAVLGQGWRVSGGGDPASVPLALDIDALQRDIHWQLSIWEPPVREAAGLSREVTTGVRPLWAVAVAAAVIGAHVDTLANLGPVASFAAGWAAGPVELDGLAAVAALRAAHRSARVVVAADRQVWRQPGDCSGCGASALRRKDGSETIYCAACDRRWLWDDYRMYCNLILGAK